jgi:predicted DNA-binding protein (UPF0251 family)
LVSYLFFITFLLTSLLAYANNDVMARPQKCRCIGCSPNSSYFKPKGIPLFHLEEVSLKLDEIEAIRLADYEGLYQEEAAAKMKISRQTLGRILNLAHRKVAEALIQGKALKIETVMPRQGRMPAQDRP